MKKIQASIVLQPERMDEVKAILKQAGCPGSAMKGPQGRRRRKGLSWQWRVEMLPKIHLEITAPDSEAERLAQALWAVASTAQAADGEMCFYEVEETPKAGDLRKKAEGIFSGQALLSVPGDEIDARRAAC